MCCVYLRQIPKQNEISNAYTQGVLHTGRTQAIHEEPAVRIKNKSRKIFLPLFRCTLICNIIYHICMYDMYKYWCCACDICENYANLLENVLHAKCDLISPSEIAFPSTFPPLFAFAMRPLINAIFNFGEVRIKYANFPISANVIRSLCECVYIWCVCLSVPLSLCCLLVCLFFFVACACLFPNFATTNDKNCTWVMVYQWKYAQKPLRQMQSEKESRMLATLWRKRSCLG